MIRTSILLVLMGSLQLFACSEIGLTGTGISITARTMDLPYPVVTSPGYVVLNPRGIARTSPTDGLSPPLQWVSQYGSVDVYLNNSIGAADGINEKGLTASLLWLDNSMYSTSGSLPTLAISLVAQYFLDNFATVAEAVASLSDNYRIINAQTSFYDYPVSLHLITHDATGDSALIEFTSMGVMNVYHPIPMGTYPVNVVTNEDHYPINLALLPNYLPFGGMLPIPGSSDSQDRFVRLSANYTTLPPSPTGQTSATQAITNILSAIFTVVQPFESAPLGPPDVSPWPTQWITVRDSVNLTASYYSNPSYKQSYVDLKKIDFSSIPAVVRSLPLDGPNTVSDITLLLLTSSQ